MSAAGGMPAAAVGQEETSAPRSCGALCIKARIRGCNSMGQANFWARFAMPDAREVVISRLGGLPSRHFLVGRWDGRFRTEVVWAEGTSREEQAKKGGHREEGARPTWRPRGARWGSTAPG